MISQQILQKKHVWIWKEYVAFHLACIIHTNLFMSFVYFMFINHFIPDGDPKDKQI